MRSKNFEFLRRYHVELAELGALAEEYIQEDPASALVTAYSSSSYNEPSKGSDEDDPESLC